MAISLVGVSDLGQRGGAMAQWPPLNTLVASALGHDSANDYLVAKHSVVLTTQMHLDFQLYNSTLWLFRELLAFRSGALGFEPTPSN